MHRVIAIFKRDFAAYFRSPMGYVLLAIFMALGGIFFAAYVTNAQIDLVGELSFLQSFFFVLIPMMTMRTFAEDRRNGTEVLLYTSPASTLEIVLAKYFSALALFLLMTASTLLHVIITALYGGLIDVSVLGAYIGFIFLGAAYLAIGIFASALTENQIIAAVISFVIIISLTLLNEIASMIGSFISTFVDKINFFGLTDTQISGIGQTVTDGLQWLNPSTRISNYINGIFEVSPLVYFISIVATFIFLTNRIIEKRRWSQR